MKFYACRIVFLFVLGSLGYASAVTLKVEHLILGVNGTDVAVVCTASHKYGYPIMHFAKKYRTYSNRITNSTDPGRIIVTESRLKDYTVQLSLHFKPMILTDDSVYSCVASYDGGPRATSQFRIGVLPEKAIPVIEMKSIQTARTGEAAELECKVSSYVNVMRYDTYHTKLIVKWKFQKLHSSKVVDIASDSHRTVDNTESQQGPDGNFTLHVTSLLKITSVDFGYSGTYICTVGLELTEYPWPGMDQVFHYKHNGTFLAVHNPAVHGAIYLPDFHNPSLTYRSCLRVVLFADSIAADAATTKLGESVYYINSSHNAGDPLPFTVAFDNDVRNAIGFTISAVLNVNWCSDGTEEWVRSGDYLTVESYRFTTGNNVSEPLNLKLGYYDGGSMEAIWIVIVVLGALSLVATFVIVGVCSTMKKKKTACVSKDAEFAKRPVIPREIDIVKKPLV